MDSWCWVGGKKENNVYVQPRALNHCNGIVWHLDMTLRVVINYTCMYILVLVGGKLTAITKQLKTKLTYMYKYLNIIKKKDCDLLLYNNVYGTCISDK